MSKKKYTFIDLFAGCGGLSEGFLQTGHFKALAHVEWEKPMVDTLRNRLVEKWGESVKDAKRQVVLFDIQKTDELLNGFWSDESNQKYGLYNADEIKSVGLKGLVGKQHVDLIIGGPHVRPIPFMVEPQTKIPCKTTIATTCLRVFVRS